MKNIEETNCIGIDFGGSGLRTGLVNSKGVTHHLEIHKFPENQKIDNVYLKNSLSCAIVEIKEAHREHIILGIGIGSPGPLDSKFGIIECPPNLPDIQNFDVVNILKRDTQLPVFLLNDANAATIAECWIGAGRGYKDVVMLTLGTGVGSGIIAGGKLQCGKGKGGEWGHASIYIIDNPPICSCGELSHVESFLGTEALFRLYRSVYCDHFKSNQIARVIHDGLKISNADSGYNIIFDHYVRYISEALKNIVSVHHPECIILGGGIALELGDYLVPVLEKEFVSVKGNMKVLFQGIKIKIAELDQAGVVGAAKYAMDALKAREVEV